MSSPPPKDVIVQAIRAEAKELRQQADNLWDRGHKDQSSELHLKASKLEVQARNIENGTLCPTCKRPIV